MSVHMNTASGIFRAAILLVPLVALGACSTVRDEMGLVRKGPDEFAVVTRAPLAVPEKFELTPPKPGAPRPQEMDPAARARAALGAPASATTPGATVAATAAPSQGEQALLQASGGDKANPGVRDQMLNEQRLAGDRGLTDRIMFWRGSSSGDKAIDPKEEAERLRKAAEKGDPAAKPTIEKDGQQGLLGSIF